MLARLNDIDYARNNADFQDALSTVASRPERLADHDAPVAYFAFPVVPSASMTSVVSAPNPSAQGQLVTFTATVTTDDGPVSEGTVTFSDGGVDLSGPIELGADGTAQFSTSSLAPGTHVITATFSGSEEATASSGATTHVVDRAITVDDVTVVEPNLGLQTAVFTLRLSSPSTTPVTVLASTANGSATAWHDYVPRSSTVTFPAGATTATFAVLVIGDLVDEGDEMFFVNLSNASSARIADGQAIGTIVDSDPAPRLFISDATVTEGNAGSKTATFIVVMAPFSSSEVTVNFTTANGTALAGSDYLAAGGSLTFTPGALIRTISVPIIGDTAFENDEQFRVILSAPAGATIADSAGVGTILNDDRRPRR
jgi:hypothetical protein